MELREGIMNDALIFLENASLHKLVMMLICARLLYESIYSPPLMAAASR